jgi:predicted secreted protein
MATNTTTYTGENGVVKFVGGDSTVATVASVRSFTIDQEVQSIESTVMGSGARSYIPGLRQFSGSMDLYLRDDDAGQRNLLSFANGGGSEGLAKLELYPSGDTAPLVGQKLSGNVIITNFSITSNFDGMVEATADFQGSGSLSITNI